MIPGDGLKFFPRITPIPESELVSQQSTATPPPRMAHPHKSQQKHSITRKENCQTY